MHDVSCIHTYIHTYMYIHIKYENNYAYMHTHRFIDTYVNINMFTEDVECSHFEQFSSLFTKAKQTVYDMFSFPTIGKLGTVSQLIPSQSGSNQALFLWSQPILP